MAFFIIRSKNNTKFRRLYSREVDKSTGLRCDQTIVLTDHDSAKEYPEKLRRVKFFDAETEKRFSFLTNNFIVPVLVIAELYRCRWQVELFFLCAGRNSGKKAKTERFELLHNSTNFKCYSFRKITFITANYGFKLQ